MECVFFADCISLHIVSAKRQVYSGELSKGKKFRVVYDYAAVVSKKQMNVNKSCSPFPAFNRTIFKYISHNTVHSEELTTFANAHVEIIV